MSNPWAWIAVAILLFDVVFVLLMHRRGVIRERERRGISTGKDHMGRKG